MSFNWYDYLEISKFTMREEISVLFPEAFYRCAISRSYYAVFCSLKSYLVQNGYSEPSKGSTHNKLLIELKNRGGNFRKIYRLLKQMKENRVIADYRNKSEKPPFKLAKSNIVNADKIFVLIQSLP